MFLFGQQWHALWLSGSIPISLRWNSLPVSLPSPVFSIFPHTSPILPQMPQSCPSSISFGHKQCFPVSMEFLVPFCLALPSLRLRIIWHTPKCFPRWDRAVAQRPWLTFQAECPRIKQATPPKGSSGEGVAKALILRFWTEERKANLNEPGVWGNFYMFKGQQHPLGPGSKWDCLRPPLALITTFHK